MLENSRVNHNSIDETQTRSLTEVECFNVAKNFAAFGFRADFLVDKSEFDRIDIARSYAVASPGNLISNIKQFAISNPDARLEIAKMAMEGHPYALGKTLNDFNIIRYEDRLELAIGIAKKLGGK